jgi:hypothetical protein
MSIQRAVSKKSYSNIRFLPTLSPKSSCPTETPSLRNRKSGSFADWRGRGTEGIPGWTYGEVSSQVSVS